MDNLRRRMVEMDRKFDNRHLASALSCVDTIDNIFKQMREGDEFVLSKGHASLAYYAVLEKNGFKPDWSKLHPDRDPKNRILVSTGSLGHGLPLAVGIAWGKKLIGKKGDVYVLLGDGECQEGTTWESMLFATRMRLNNLAVIIDDNGYQALEKTIYPAVQLLEQCFKYINVVKNRKGKGLRIFDNFPNHVQKLSDLEYDQCREDLNEDTL